MADATSPEIKEAMLAYLAAGISVLPACAMSKNTKLGNWTPFIARVPSVNEIDEWCHKFTNSRVAVVCGEISGGLHCLDIDDHAGASWFKRAMVRTGNAALLERLVIESTFHGSHVFWRSEVGAAPCNRMVNLDQKIEIRVGGYVICAPSQGYIRVQGNLIDVPTLTLEERDLLIAIASEDPLR